MSRLLSKTIELLATTDKPLTEICREADVTYPWLTALKGSHNGTKFPAVDKIERLYEFLSGTSLDLTAPAASACPGRGTERLFDIGFAPVGYWRLDGDLLRLELTNMIEHSNVLYAFISDDDVLYVGKTTQTLRRRMASYLKPGSTTQSTNIRNNAAIVELLRTGKPVEILALPDLGLHRLGEFRINYAAALEDSIIQTLAPPWNGKRRPAASTLSGGTEEDDAADEELEDNLEIAQVDEALSAGAPTFQFVLQPTYFKSGFFNVTIDNQHLFPTEGGNLDIYCGPERYLVKGRFDRTANNNGTPRVHGFTPLRDWFQRNYEPMQTVTVTVLGPSAIEIGRT
ncbi:GIY-YIG nuclease family protein [Cupriavidus metallidurans]|uniref:GIY-YIG nuclease family protein n=1 Tax=Cupriavidus metallidurans TaxID=119219 RepID=UPI001CCDA946|nr:GIY-YIG nuclease family protein [Cupriavidus metallidurans]UBM07985.1 GIY-YIG nuclease family protein [Cupriavidus metallidurans]